jgi:peptidoglycan/xylan/chitin deacetylase (PgdA/CDA1 family)
MKLQNTVILSFDVDGQRVFDFLDHLEKDYFLEEGLPRAVEFLKTNKLDATFFTVGKNIEDFPDVHKELKDFEIGNHTYSHPYFLTRKTPEEKRVEIEKTHSIIEKFYGVTPKMFRAPDYQIDGELVNILKSLGYKADSSMIKVLMPPGYLLNCIKQRDILKDQFELPLTSFIIPFNGTSAIFLGFGPTRLILEFLLKVHKVIIINFHDRDFVNMKIDKPGFWRREKALETTLEFLDYMNKRCNIMSFRQFFNASHTRT